jgi:hypothetical protein
MQRWYTCIWLFHHIYISVLSAKFACSLTVTPHLLTKFHIQPTPHWAILELDRNVPLPFFPGPKNHGRDCHHFFTIIFCVHWLFSQLDQIEANFQKMVLNILYDLCSIWKFKMLLAPIAVTLFDGSTFEISPQKSYLWYKSYILMFPYEIYVLIGNGRWSPLQEILSENGCFS